jgi:hypothetical protein
MQREVVAYGSPAALEFVTEHDPVRGAQAVNALLDVLWDQGSIRTVTPKLPGETDEAHIRRCAGEKLMAKVAAAGIAITNMHAFIAIALRDAFLSGQIAIVKPVLEDRSTKTIGGMLQIWYEETHLDLALSEYQRKMLSLFLSKLLPELIANGHEVTDDLMATIIDESGCGISVPDKVRFAISAVSDEKARTGKVSKETVDLVYDRMMDDSVTSVQMEAELRERKGKKEIVLVDGNVEILQDGKRRYTLVVNDGLGEAFERATDKIINWRMQ